MPDKKKKIFKDVKEMPLSAVSHDDMTWNKTGSWRNVRPYYDPKTSPCIGGCPAGENIQGYIALARDGKYEDAVRLIWEANPFPSVCGRVCYHPCMAACLRGQTDGAVFIPAIERYLGDYAIHEGVRILPPAQKQEEQIAVVGGGPAGLSTAYFLARRGYRVTVFEAKSELGGVLRYGIPPYRLPKDVLDAELEKLVDLGIETRTNTIIGQDITMEDLAGFSAYFLGVGLQKSRRLGLDNEDADGVMPGLRFLEAINTGKTKDIGKEVVVVGGGNTAMDVARSAVRLGANVTVLYRRTRDEMPAIDDEVDEAEDEGVEFRFLAAPSALLAAGGRIQSIESQEMELGEPVESGRRRPVARPGAFFTMDVDSLLIAVGELPDTGDFERALALEYGLVVADEYGRTSNKNIYAAGDVVTGASTVVNAIARGRGAAELIHAELRGGEFDPKAQKKVIAIADLNFAYLFHKARTEMRHDPISGTAPFAEVNLGFGCDDVQREVGRCYSCGVCDGCDNCWVFCPDVAISRTNGTYTIDYDYCKGCLICVQECPRGVLSTTSEAK